MADTIIKTQTYGCVCGYRLQGVDPFSDYYVTTFGVPAGVCASCKTGKLGLVLDAQDQSTHTVADDATLEATMVPDLNEDGTPIMDQVGEHQEIGIVNGQIGIVTVSDYVQRMRPLTDQELADLKLQRDQSLDALSAVAVSEVTN